jgi:hypothetical protein
MIMTVSEGFLGCFGFDLGLDLDRFFGIKENM